jgi:hypothetical protein
VILKKLGKAKKHRKGQGLECKLSWVWVEEEKDLCVIDTTDRHRRAG